MITCFKETQLKLTRKFYSNTADYCCGKDSNNKVYTFSDGVGMISQKSAAEIAKDLNMGQCVPSVFQVKNFLKIFKLLRL